MPVLTWIEQVVRKTFWFAFNLAVVTGIFTISAHLATQSGEDARNGSIFFRILGSFWLYIAAWNWVVRGVLQRPARPADTRKPTGAEAARSALGCLAHLAPVLLVFYYVGRIADWAWAGVTSGDTSHPARQVSDRLMDVALHAADNTGSWLPWAIAGLVAYRIVRVALGARTRRDRRNRTSAAGGPATPGRPGVADANRRTLEKLRQKGSRGASRPSPAREILAQAGRASAEKVGAAHAGAHGLDRARVTPGHGGREDRTLGALTWSSSDGSWLARRDEGFPVQIAGAADDPDPRALDVARLIVQRNFEALLRASDAAQPVAQSRGVGLPRFSIAAVRVAAGPPPVVTMHLRCDADRDHDYVVESSDNLQTFKVRS